MNEIAAIPMSGGKNGGHVPMRMREISVKQIDDGSFLMTISMEGKGKDGMHNYESKQSSHKTKEEMFEHMAGHLKGRFSERNGKKETGSGLAKRRERS